MGFVFFVGHAALANFEHVQVAPAAGDGAVGEGGDFVEDEEDRAVCARGDAGGISWGHGVASTEVVWALVKVSTHVSYQQSGMLTVKLS